MKRPLLVARLLSSVASMIPLVFHSQKKLGTDEKGMLTRQEYARFCKEKGYQAVSSFDTISLNPLLVYAATLKNNRFGIVDVYGKEIIKNDYDMIAGIYSTNSALRAYHDHFFLKKNDLWALSDAYGTLLTPLIYQAMYYEDYHPEGTFDPTEKWHPPVNKDSVFKAKLDGNYIYLNTKGEKIPIRPERTGQHLRMFPEPRITSGSQKTWAPQNG